MRMTAAKALITLPDATQLNKSHRSISRLAKTITRNIIKFSESHLRTTITDKTFNLYRMSSWRCGNTLVCDTVGCEFIYRFQLLQISNLIKYNYYTF